MCILGIDGGGTKTVGTMALMDGTIIQTKKVGPTNPNSIGFKQAESEIRQLLSALREELPEEFSKIKAVFAGMSGVDRELDKIAMTNIFSSYFDPSVPITVTNDAVNALYTGTQGKPGVVNISGTGSITLGIDHNGKVYRVGGWGFLLESSASGYSIGRDALIHVFEEYDGFGKKTAITEKVLQLFDTKAPPDLISIIYETGKSRTAISSISKIVFEAANEGDQIARSILNKAGREMAQSICHLLKKLPHTIVVNQTVKIVLAGSIYRQASWFLSEIEDQIGKEGFRGELIVPDLPPVTGSLYMALRTAGVEITDAISTTIKSTFRNY